MTRRDENQAAYRRLQSAIDRDYPKGRFVAIDRGRIVADGATYEEVDKILGDIGCNSRDVLLVEAGVDYPEYVTIFL